MMIAWVSCILTLSATSAPEADQAERSKVVVMPFQASGFSPGAVATLDELLADAVRSLNEHEVIGQSDIDAMLGLENLKDSLGCDEVACAAEIGGALGAEFLISGRLARLGKSIIIILKLINAQEQVVVRSIKHKATTDEDKYDEVIDETVSQLFGKRPMAVPGSGGPDELLRSFLSSADFQRFENYKSSTGHNVALADWVHEQNQESMPLFLGEMAAVAGLLISAGVTADHEPRIGDAPLLGVSSILAIIGLLAVDVLDLGSVEIIGQ